MQDERSSVEKSLRQAILEVMHLRSKTQNWQALYVELTKRNATLEMQLDAANLTISQLRQRIMKLEEALQQREQEMMGPPAGKEVSLNPLEEKKEAIDSCRVNFGGTANLDNNQREASVQ